MSQIKLLTVILFDVPTNLLQHSDISALGSCDL